MRIKRWNGDKTLKWGYNAEMGIKHWNEVLHWTDTMASWLCQTLNQTALLKHMATVKSQSVVLDKLPLPRIAQTGQVWVKTHVCIKKACGILWNMDMCNNVNTRTYGIFFLKVTGTFRIVKNNSKWNFGTSLLSNEYKEKYFAFVLISTTPQIASLISSMNLSGLA